MKIALVGTRWFGAEVFRLLREAGHEVVVAATNGEDTLAKAARGAGVPLVVREEPRRVGAEDIAADEVDAIVAAHTHAFVTADARRKARIASIGYHPSLLPRHRGIAAVEWTIKEKDPIAGGSVYHLSGGMDAGALAAQDWCFVYPEDDARSLWQRALAPMGLRLLVKVVQDMETRGFADAWEQDPRAVTLAPPLTEPV
ncbi:formyltransferase family protein [Enterovirga aerilata]|uniref:Methionyl-tRNA formyltransferase n=1 Tax=Enterovirga aerilata TaxID=2730920 RepID=A0A849I2U2_9HYPH|nr:formyltransferase family protein [Enterovirga sp. DB1703]NNM71678.1 methionyl-tRNA formyltransferase [Enterovirga sp. DB1703]